MSNQAQIDALECLLLAVLRRNRMTLQSQAVFDEARTLVMDKDGPPGSAQKAEASAYLKDLASKLG